MLNMLLAFVDNRRISEGGHALSFSTAKKTRDYRATLEQKIKKKQGDNRHTGDAAN